MVSCYGYWISQVRVFKFRPEPYAADSSFMPFQGSLRFMMSPWLKKDCIGLFDHLSSTMTFPWCKLHSCVLKVIIWHTTGSTKKRNNHIIQSVKLVKVDGSITAINISPRSNHLAVGSDRGDVSLFSWFLKFISF